MKPNALRAVVIFAVFAALSGWCSTGVVNGLLSGLHPQIAPGPRTLPAFGMVFCGLGAIVLPLVVILNKKHGE